MLYKFLTPCSKCHFILYPGVTSVSKLNLTKSTFVTSSDSKEIIPNLRIWDWFSDLVRFESSGDLITNM